MKKKIVEIEDISLRDALAVVDNLEASDTDTIVAARKTLLEKKNYLESLFSKVTKALEALPVAEQGCFVFADGETTEVLQEEKTTIKINTKKLLEDANPIVEASYSDDIYSVAFNTKPRINRKKVLELEEEGRLPNASEVVKRTTVVQTKLLDYKEEK